MTRIFDHIDLRVRDLQASAPFYRQLLPLLGFSIRVDIPGWLQFEAPGREATDFFGVTEDPGHANNRTNASHGPWAISRVLNGEANSSSINPVRRATAKNWLACAAVHK